MILDAWIYAIPADWDSLAAGEDEAPFSYAYSQARTGHWKTYTGGHEVYNVLGSAQDIQDIIDALPNPPAKVYGWIQGNGFDDLDTFPTDPTDVLAVMKDHVEYDEDGNIISTTPASLEAPSWGHVFLGQKPRIFAGDFTTDFSGDFK